MDPQSIPINHINLIGLGLTTCHPDADICPESPLILYPSHSHNAFNFSTISTEDKIFNKWFKHLPNTLNQLHVSSVKCILKRQVSISSLQLTRVLLTEIILPEARTRLCVIKLTRDYLTSYVQLTGVYLTENILLKTSICLLNILLITHTSLLNILPLTHTSLLNILPITHTCLLVHGSHLEQRIFAGTK